MPERLERLRSAAMRIAMRELGNRHDAEDAVQDALEKALVRWDKYDPGRGSLKGWFFGMVNSCCQDEKRRRSGRGGRRQEILFSDVSWVEAKRHRAPLPKVPSLEEIYETRNEVDQAFTELSPRQAEVVELKGQGLSRQAIARELGISPNTVKSHLTRARQVLRKHIEL